MSYSKENLEAIENAQADFDGFLAEGKYDDCRAIIDNLGDEGYENEAIFLHKALNRCLSETLAQENDRLAEEDLAKSPAERRAEAQDLADRSYPNE